MTRLAVPILAALLATPAAAQTCLPYADLAAALSGAPHLERLAFRGVVASGELIEVWVNSVTGTWSAVRVVPATPPVGCMLTAGEGGVLVPPPLPGVPS